MVYSGIAENFRSGKHAAAKTIDKSCKTKEWKIFLIEKKRKLDCYKRRVHWKKLEAQSVVVFHWLSYLSLSLAGLLPGQEKIFFPTARVVNTDVLPVGDAGYPVPINIWGLQLPVCGRA